MQKYMCKICQVEQHQKILEGTVWTEQIQVKVILENLKWGT